MNLWHKRLGYSKAKIGFMNKQAVGEGMNIRGVSTGCDKACKCIKCTLARAERINPRKQRLYDDDVCRPFEVVSTDIKGPLIESRGGRRYTISFVDQLSRYAKTYYMRRKSEASEKLKEYMSWVKARG